MCNGNSFSAFLFFFTVTYLYDGRRTGCCFVWVFVTHPPIKLQHFLILIQSISFGLLQMVGVVEENTSMIDEQGREGREASGKHCQEYFINGHYCSQIIMWTLKCLRWVHSHSGGTVTGIYRVEMCVQGLWDQGLGCFFRTGFTRKRDGSFVEVNMKVEERFYFQGQWWVVSKMISWCWTGSCSWRYCRLKALKFLCLVTLNLILMPSW